MKHDIENIVIMYHKYNIMSEVFITLFNFDFSTNQSEMNNQEISMYYNFQVKYQLN